jgi:hypothetical protein
MGFAASRTVHCSRRPPADPGQEKAAALVALTYELLDAHADTACLAGDESGGAGDVEWQNHLAYLRDLQRVAREVLARVVAVDGDPVLVTPPRGRMQSSHGRR